MRIACAPPPSVAAVEWSEGARGWIARETEAARPRAASAAPRLPPCEGIIATRHADTASHQVFEGVDSEGVMDGEAG
eukprot:351375-Chlamydomonas_euryale.AAC.11